MIRSFIFICSISVAAHAATVVSVSGSEDFGGSIGNNQAQTAGFSTSQAYSNVAISALIQGPAAQTFNAYLTTQIGPGTTIADQVAFDTLNLPGFNPGVLTPIFTGLNLAAGTYYLTLFNPENSSGGWTSTENPLIVTDAGAAHVFSGYFITNDNPLPYPPAAAFADHLVEAGRTLIYSVEEIPEPGTAYLSLVAVLGLLAMRMRARN